MNIRNINLNDIIDNPVVLGEAIIGQITGESPSYDGALFLTGGAEGAIPNGTRIRKCTSFEGDTFPNGTLGTVLSSLGPITEEMARGNSEIIGEYGYFINWDPVPDAPVFTRGAKIESVNYD